MENITVYKTSRWHRFIWLLGKPKRFIQDKIRRWKTGQYYKKLGYPYDKKEKVWVAPDGRWCNIIPKKDGEHE